MACTHRKPKNDVELWLIDEAELNLYRKLHSGKEQVIPIKDNKSIRGFMCIPEGDLKELVWQSLCDGGS